jgi:hypothetical protein
VVRVWADPAASEGFVARLTGSRTLESPAEPVGVAGSVDDVLEAVRRWLVDTRSAWVETRPPEG